jgi:uncharacterized small protein (DUF1192 family)
MSLKKLPLGLVAFSNLTFAGMFPFAPFGNTQVQNTNNTQYKGYPYQYPQYRHPQIPAGGAAQMADADTLNVLTSLETDLLIFNEAAALLKLNQLMLERLPVSLEDNWPELLIKFRDEKGLDKKILKAYQDELDEQLKKEFWYYGQLLYGALSAASGLSGNPLSWVKTGVKLAQTMSIIGMGRKLEHAKWVVYYKPPVCNSKTFATLFDIPKDKIAKERKYCNLEKKYQGCNIFKQSWEKVLTEYWYKSKNHSIEDWVSLKVNIECLHPVKGRLYGTFDELFFTLLPSRYQAEIKEVDQELGSKLEKKGTLEAQLKSLENKLNNPQKLKKEDVKKLTAEKAALEKRIKVLEDEIKRLKGAREKLYNQARREVELTKEKYELAKKLYHIADYVADTDNKIFALVTVSVAKFVLDLYDALRYAPKVTVMAITSAATTPPPSNGQITQQVAMQRLKYLITNILTSPATVFSIYGSLMAQKDLIEQRRDYLEALITVGKKIYEPKPEKKEKK